MAQEGNVYYGGSEKRTEYYDVDNNVYEEIKDFQSPGRPFYPQTMRLVTPRRFNRKWLCFSIAIGILLLLIAIIIGVIVFKSKKHDTSSMLTSTDSMLN